MIKTDIPTKPAGFWMFQANPDTFKPGGTNSFRVDGRAVPTSLENFRQVDFATEPWGVLKYKKHVRPGHLVVVRINGREAAGGVGLLRVTRVEVEQNRMFLDKVPGVCEALTDDPIPDARLLEVLAVRPYPGLMDVLPAWAAFRAELVRRAHIDDRTRPPKDPMRFSVIGAFDPARTPAVPKPGEGFDTLARAAALEKAVTGHHALLLALQARLVELGVPPEDIEEDRGSFDLRARGTIFEAKTTTSDNLHHQVRLGLAQLLDYAVGSGPEWRSLCLVVDRRTGLRQKALLEFADIGCLAWVSGKWFVEVGDDDHLLRRIAGLPVGSAAARLAARRRKTPLEPAPVVVDPSRSVVILATDLAQARVQEAAFIVMQAWLDTRRVPEGAEAFVFAGSGIPHHRGLNSWLAFTEPLVPGLIDVVQSSLERLGGAVEREVSQLGAEQRFVAPLARLESGGIERLVSDRAKYPDEVVVAPPVVAGGRPLRARVRPCVVSAAAGQRA